jgi:hypothetical protein
LVINKKRYEKKTEDIAFMWRNCLSLSAAAPTRKRWHKKRKNKLSGAKLDPMKNTADKATIKTPGMYCTGLCCDEFSGNQRVRFRKCEHWTHVGCAGKLTTLYETCLHKD